MLKLILGAVATVLLIAVAVTLPAAVGIGLMKVYRHFVPLEESKAVGIEDILESKGDSFFKILAIGWIVCSPLYYWVFASGLLN